MLVESPRRIRTRLFAYLTISLLLLPSPIFSDSHPLQATILCYHMVESPNDSIYSLNRQAFREQMQYLKTTGYNVIPLADLLDYIEGKRETLPPNPVVITIDDGWRCTYSVIYPELKKLGFPFTVFIYPKFVSRTKGTYALTWEEIKEMAEDGVDIQSHSFSHPFLTHRRQPELSMPDYMKFLHNELSRSKEQIENATGRPVRFLAYPYGDYDTRVARAVEQAGYAGALTCDYGQVRKGSNPFRMRRVSIYKHTSFATFREDLGTGRLRLEAITPPPGKVFNPENPVIEAKIENFDQLDPQSVGMTLLSLGQTPYSYNPEDGSISLVVRDKLPGNEQRVVVWGSERETGRRVEAAWKFYLAEPEPPATPAQTAATKAAPSPDDPALSRQPGQHRR